MKKKLILAVIGMTFITGSAFAESCCFKAVGSANKPNCVVKAAACNSSETPFNGTTGTCSGKNAAPHSVSCSTSQPTGTYQAVAIRDVKYYFFGY